MERRNFIRNIAVGSTAAIFAPTLLAMTTPADLRNPVGGLVPFLMFEDCVKLVLGSPFINNEFKEALTGDIHRPVAGNLARLSGSLPNGRDHILNMLNKFRSPGAKQEIKLYSEKLSFVMGWVLLKAATKGVSDYNLKLLKSKNKLEEVIAYQDSLLLKARLGSASIGTPAKDETSSLLLGVLTRAVTRIHTFTPDKSDGREWIIRTADWRQKNKTSMDMLGAIIENPDPVKKNLFWDKPVFFDPNDPVIESNFQYDALAAKNKSLYATGIVNGYNAVLNAQNYLEGKTSVETITKLI